MDRSSVICFPNFKFCFLVSNICLCAMVYDLRLLKVFRSRSLIADDSSSFLPSIFLYGFSDLICHKLQMFSALFLDQTIKLFKYLSAQNSCFATDCRDLLSSFIFAFILNKKWVKY